MGEFEFISVLISLIIGLGITNLLSGAGRAFYRRRKSPIDEVHMVLTVVTILILVLNWWVTFSWRAETNWTFEKFLVLIVWMVSLFMLTIFLYPPDLSEAEEARDIWLHNRVGYYGAFVVMCLFDILQTAMRGGLLHPIWYVPYVGHYAVLSAIGMIMRRRGYDRFFAWYQLITIVAWSLFFRRFLLQAGLT
ncbi:MAG: hypothetical protein DMF06_00340 [Verrucomicrobia bacterium]|nr:MAG: hypothetical protein DMF06_00340 [Verrucomicrobiota bacterium]